MTKPATKGPVAPEGLSATFKSTSENASGYGSASSRHTTASADSEEQRQGEKQTSAPGLLDELRSLWKLQIGLWLELKTLLSAESALALKSVAQLIVGTGVLLIFLSLCIVLLQLLVGMAALAIGFSPLGAVLLLLVVNVTIVIALYCILRYLPENLRFKHSRAALKSSQGERESKESQEQGAEDSRTQESAK